MTKIDGENCIGGQTHQFDTAKSRIEYNTSKECLPDTVIHFEDEFDERGDYLHKTYTCIRCKKKVRVTYECLHAELKN